MALSITGQQVEVVVRQFLANKGFGLSPPLTRGQTGPDILARKSPEVLAIECIGFQDVPPLRSKQFYEAFFRAISRLRDGATQCIMALPVRFGNGMDRRARHYGMAWQRIANIFPELRIWLVNTKTGEVEQHTWGDWPASTLNPRSKADRRQWLPRPETIGDLVRQLLQKNHNISNEEARSAVLKRFPKSKFNKTHLAWYKSQFKRSAATS
jgi:hypothetical protein